MSSKHDDTLNETTRAVIQAEKTLAQAKRVQLRLLANEEGSDSHLSADGNGLITCYPKQGRCVFFFEKVEDPSTADPLDANKLVLHPEEALALAWRLFEAYAPEVG